MSQLISHLTNAIITATVAVIVNPVLRPNLVFSLRSHCSKNIAVPDKSRIATKMFTAQAIASLPASFVLQVKGQPYTNQKKSMLILGTAEGMSRAEAATTIAKHVTRCK